MPSKFRILTSRTEKKNNITYPSCSISDKSICYSISEQCSISSAPTISYDSHQTYNSTAITTLESVKHSQLITNFPNIEEHYQTLLLTNLNKSSTIGNDTRLHTFNIHDQHITVNTLIPTNNRMMVEQCKVSPH